MLGATVARIDAANGRSDEYNAVRTLVGQLIDTLAEKALSTLKPKVSVLGHVVPELIIAGASYQGRLLDYRIDRDCSGAGERISSTI